MKGKIVASKESIDDILLSFTKLGIVRTLPMPLPKIETPTRQQEWNEPANKGAPTLAQPLARAGGWQKIPLALTSGVKIKFPSDRQNALVKNVITEFCSRFTPGGKLVHVGDGGNKWSYFDEDCLRSLGVGIQQDGQLPDAVLHFTKMNWIVLIQLATSQGPVNEKRLTQLSSLFGSSKLHLVFVSAFLNRRDFSKCRRNIAWGTHLWIAADPDHMIHLNGGQFLKPHSRPLG